ncbi:MAG TPA: 3-dehydroquinate synthase II [Streptosporangiaceae bacterium]|nr:3-dehydroquinate synthase II [Streptosporangiaceae bacterium]
MKLAWIDVRSLTGEHRDAVVEAAVHARVDGVVAGDPEVLAAVPATVRRVVIAAEPPGDHGPDDLIMLHEVTDADELAGLRARSRSGSASVAGLVNVADDLTLTLACETATVLPYTVVRFKDPTKIPLEIVIAAADGSAGRLICEVADIEEAKIVIEVLEKGSEGVLLAPRDANDVFELMELLRVKTPDLSLTTLTIESTEHLGLGDRVCVDTCTYLAKDEGMLIGSYAHGFVLCVSETHPLPYMPTRPFRVNAGALHSYILGQDNRTNYLSELRAGSVVLAVGADGRTRRVVVGRIKLESRPLLGIRAISPDGVEVNLIVQDDWHVRVLGPGAGVLNVTELAPGDQVLGHVATDKRHVGWPVGEFCIEK